jgi:hypothetical protein
MFINQGFRRSIVSAVLVVAISSVSIPSFAMKRTDGAPNWNDPAQNIQNAILAAQLIAALMQNAPHLLQQALQGVPNLLPQQPVVEPQAEVLPATPVAERRDLPVQMQTPKGCSRVPCSRPERRLNFFISPNSKGGKNVIYAQLPKHIHFEPKINPQGRMLSREEFNQRLRSHPRYNDLMEARRMDLNRYSGKAVSSNPDYTSYSRFCAEGRHAANGGASRHDRSLREQVNIHQNIFEDINPDQDLELERWLIEEIDSNWGNGVNSNAGGHKRKISSLEEDEQVRFGSDWLADDCRSDHSKKGRFDENDEDDDSSGTDSFSSSPSSPLNSLQAIGSEVC